MPCGVGSPHIEPIMILLISPDTAHRTLAILVNLSLYFGHTCSWHVCTGRTIHSHLFLQSYSSHPCVHTTGPCSERECRRLRCRRQSHRGIALRRDVPGAAVVSRSGTDPRVVLQDVSVAEGLRQQHHRRDKVKEPMTCPLGSCVLLTISARQGETSLIHRQLLSAPEIWR